MIDKSLFIECIEQIKLQSIHDDNCHKAFKIILPVDYISGYNNGILYNQLIKVLKVLCDDTENNWIEYYIYELEFGKLWHSPSVKIDGKSFRLKTSEDLWRLLNLKK
jgi:hypothetical protein